MRVLCVSKLARPFSCWLIARQPFIRGFSDRVEEEIERNGRDRPVF
jgi:hypothetical protein